MDLGKFHSACARDWQEFIIPLFQPAHSQATFWNERFADRESSRKLSREDSPQKLAPELNPIERLWEHFQAQLQWENYQSLKQLRLRLSDLLEQLTPDLIASLTGWDFITTAVFSSSS